MLKFRSNRINIEALLRVFILFGFSILFYTILATGQAPLYVHPRIVPYMKFGIVVMTILGVMLVPAVLKPVRKTISLVPYLIFIVPMLSGFFVPASAMDTSFIASEDFKTRQQSTVKSTNNERTTIPESGYIFDENDLAALDIEEYIEGYANDKLDYEYIPPKPADLDLESNKIIITEENFIDWNDELYMNLYQHEGKTAEITGIVLKDESYDEDEFAVVRFMMSCCTADLQPIGLFARSDDAKTLQNDTWVSVSGVVKILTYGEDEYPAIIVNEIRPVDKPESEYVYPVF